MSQRKLRVSARSAHTPWIWEGAGYLLAVALVGTELIARLTLVVMR